MEELNHKKAPRALKNNLFHILVCLLILGAGVFGMTTLAGSKKPPDEAQSQELALQVEAIRMHPENAPIAITGYGEVHPLHVVAIAPEVAGTIVALHPRLDAGEIIPRGETLFKIDNRNYLAAAEEAYATVRQWENTVKRLRKQSAMDRQRLKTLKRNRELARLEFQRLQNLYRNHKVGTRSGVDKIEQVFNTAVDRVDQMNQTLELYPLQIKEVQSSLASAQARLDMAQINLTRCGVTVNFDARVKSVTLERGQYVTTGQQVLTLADDSMLEIQIPVDSRDARQWLQFNGRRGHGGTAWFSELEPVICRIRWTEDNDNHTWRGRLHRVVRFNPQTRTLTAAVRLSSDDAAGNGSGGLPLVEGMFCAVDIPGTTLGDVYSLPSWAVSYENTVYLVKDSRLKTIPVKVARVKGDTAIISDGLQPGDLVVSTRLADPLENTLLNVTTIDTQGS